MAVLGRRGEIEPGSVYVDGSITQKRPAGPLGPSRTGEAWYQSSAPRQRPESGSVERFPERRGRRPTPLGDFRAVTTVLLVVVPILALAAGGAYRVRMRRA